MHSQAEIDAAIAQWLEAGEREAHAVHVFFGPRGIEAQWPGQSRRRVRLWELPRLLWLWYRRGRVVRCVDERAGTAS